MDSWSFIPKFENSVFGVQSSAMEVLGWHASIIALIELRLFVESKWKVILYKKPAGRRVAELEFPPAYLTYVTIYFYCL